MIEFIRKHPIPVGLAILLHIIVVILMTAQWHDSDKVIKAYVQGSDTQKPLNATKTSSLATFAVDQRLIKQQLERIKIQQKAKKLEQQQLLTKMNVERERLKNIKKQQRVEQLKVEKAKRLAKREKQKANAERSKANKAKKDARLANKARKKADAKAELARKASKNAMAKVVLAKKKRKAEELKKVKLLKEIARKSKEKRILEAETIEVQEKQERALAVSERQQQLDAEATVQRAAQKRKQLGALRETYISSITAKVQNNWRTPARISEKAQCDLMITQTLSGSVSSVKVLNCNGYATKQFKQAAEKAVYRSEPLPAPPVKELFERVITFTFKP